jgi:hypothetical protein
MLSATVDRSERPGRQGNVQVACSMCSRAVGRHAMFKSGTGRLLRAAVDCSTFIHWPRKGGTDALLFILHGALAYGPKLGLHNSAPSTGL